jgi:lipopolysaccharide transport system permease protein
MLDMPKVGQKSALAENEAYPIKRRDGPLQSVSRTAVHFAAFTLAPFTVSWRYRELTRALLRRDLADRFRGTAFGWAWAIVAPVITLAIYTRAFTHVMRLPAASAQGSWTSYALSTFVGLIIFGVCAELFYRAPGLLHERASYIKYSIFPSEMLAWTAVFRAFAYAGISVMVLLVFELVANGTVPVSALTLPLILLPLVLLLLGAVWCLAALGAFNRDIAYLMVTVVPAFMIVTPVFYRVSDLPERMQNFAYINPIAAPIEMSRAVLLDGVFPSTAVCIWYVAIAYMVFRCGFAVFVRYKGILADVI